MKWEVVIRLIGQTPPLPELEAWAADGFKDTPLSTALGSWAGMITQFKVLRTLLHSDAHYRNEDH